MKLTIQKLLKKLYEEKYLYVNFDKLVIENEDIFQKLIQVCPIKNNRKSDIKTITNIKNFKETVDVLYQIRCNLFHGSKGDTNERDKNVLDASTPVLELIVKQIIG